MITRREIQEQINHLKVPVDVSFTTFLDASAPEDMFACCNVTEHIFVSAIIVHLLSRKVLLLHHRTLDQWVFPEDISILMINLLLRPCIERYNKKQV